MAVISDLDEKPSLPLAGWGEKEICSEGKSDSEKIRRELRVGERILAPPTPTSPPTVDPNYKLDIAG